MLSLLAVLLIIAPLLSSSLRPTYLYFITNILIIALGAEAGLISFFSKPLDAHQKHTKHPESAPPDKRGALLSQPTTDEKVAPESANHESKADKVRVEKCLSEKINDVNGTDHHHVDQADKVKKYASIPSLFFIGGGDQTEGGDSHDQVDQEDKDEEGVVGEINGQELFAKSETFIRNFYKQLKMQREESWKRIHGVYHKAF